MAGRFEGLRDLEWRLFEDIFPPAPPKRGRGMPHAPFRKIWNTLLYVWPCTCTLRINTPGSPVDRFRSKKSYQRGLS
jgi:hypothetical protein